ncbi:hypothetical protein CBR_g41081 [Chara braunii]|uniref:Uncharacterized protein n=1 Tax=Chara braunii TaxID=69332 RepID=A0A388LV29_CHABU|nr:hypothetical protein CBR_g41081 [Chara braunii]|eukprot:GBG86177.1 hypothetical protein CBR_g41081 [Chara braunii]
MGVGILPGPCARENYGAMDCNAQGLLAYATGTTVVVVEVRTMQLVSTLSLNSKQDAAVTAVRWSPEGLSRDLGHGSPLRLAAGDRAGRIIIWDVTQEETVAVLVLVDGDKDRGGRDVVGGGGGVGGVGGGGGGGGGRITGPIGDLYWVYGHPWMVAAIHGGTHVLIWDTTSCKPLWRFDATESLSCVRADPIDPRLVAITGTRGLLLVLVMNGKRDGDITQVQHRMVVGEEREVQKGGDERMKDKAMEKEKGGGGGGGVLGIVKCLFSNRARGLLYVMTPREIVAFDLQFGMPVDSTALPRGYTKLLDMLALVEGDLLYCVHVDGKLSCWKRREGRQAFFLRHVETLLPTIAATVPGPQLISTVYNPHQWTSTILPGYVASGVACSSGNGSIDGGRSQRPPVRSDSFAFDGPVESLLQDTSAVSQAETASSSGLSVAVDGRTVMPNNVSITTFVSMTDDGRLWKWVARNEVQEAGGGALVGGADGGNQSSGSGSTPASDRSNTVGGVGGEGVCGGGSGGGRRPSLEGREVLLPKGGDGGGGGGERDKDKGGGEGPSTPVGTPPSPGGMLIGHLASGTPRGGGGGGGGGGGEYGAAASASGMAAGEPSVVVKVSLTGMMHTLPSPISTIAVPSPMGFPPSAGGRPLYQQRVPLVALATQAGTIELVDTSALTVTASFAVHKSAVRGVRWLGNSRLASFSFTEVKGKGGGFTNRLVVTCVRSGQSRPFRLQQKPEKAPMRGLRASPSGRYLLILFRDAPAEVWLMTRSPQLLRSLALPITVMEWALPPIQPLDNLHSGSRRSTVSDTPPTPGASGPQSDAGLEESGESFAFALVNGSLGVFELRGRRVRDFRPKWPAASFVPPDVLVTAMAYRLPHVVMGDRGGNLRAWDVSTGQSSTFNTHRGGIRRIKFAPSVPSTASSSLHSSGGGEWGRVAVLFNDHTFTMYDLDAPSASAVVNLNVNGLYVTEIDFLPAVGVKDPLLLGVTPADGSFRLLQVPGRNTNSYTVSKRRKPFTRGSSRLEIQPPPPPSPSGSGNSSFSSGTGGNFKSPGWERLHAAPICTPLLLPTPHALALRMLLQQGVEESWVRVGSAADWGGADPLSPLGTVGGDLRRFLLNDGPVLGDKTVPEVLLKALETHRRGRRLLDDDAASAYVAVCHSGTAARCAFTAAHYGDVDEAVFWVHLPRALALLSHGSAGPGAFWGSDAGAGLKRERERGAKTTNRVINRVPSKTWEGQPPSLDLSGEMSRLTIDVGGLPPPSFPSSSACSSSSSSSCSSSSSSSSSSALAAWPAGRGKIVPLQLPNLPPQPIPKMVARTVEVVSCEQPVLRALAKERISWHEKLSGRAATQKRVHEYVSVGDYESAVTLLLSTSPDSDLFFLDALRAVALASAVSPAMHELAIKVVAANMGATDDPLAATHLLCAAGRYPEACIQLQDAGRWTDAATLAAAHLKGTERSRVMERWAQHVLNTEHNLWRALILFVSAGALVDALAAIKSARLPDTAAMFLVACHEAKANARKQREQTNQRKRVGGGGGSCGEGFGGRPPSGSEHVFGAPMGGGDEENRLANVAAAGPQSSGSGGSRLENPLGGVGGGTTAALAGPAGGSAAAAAAAAAGESRRETGAAAVDKDSAVMVDDLDLPGDLQTCKQEVTAICEYYAHYQRLVAHICGNSQAMGGLID